MTEEEQIKQKAEAEADKIIIGSGMDRASVIHLKHLLVTMYMQGATEATKELVIKDKLKKEAEEWLCNNLHSASEEDFIKAMVDFAEPREKQIQVLGEHCLQLQKDKGNLTDRCTELEAETQLKLLQMAELINEQDKEIRLLRQDMDIIERGFE